MAGGSDRSPDAPGAPAELRRSVGQCVDCRFARTQTSARGSRFWRCQRAEWDSRLLRYPPLPVRGCPGFESRARCRARSRET
jgi:hypothetical protein